MGGVSTDYWLRKGGLADIGMAFLSEQRNNVCSTKLFVNRRRLMFKTLAIAISMSAVTLPATAQTTIKFAHALATNSHYGVGTDVFCNSIEKGTSSRYKCQQFPNSALGGEREMIESVQLGTLDIVLTSTGPVGNFVPDVKVLDIPFLFRDYDHARKTLDGSIGQDLLAKFPQHGLVALTWTENGFRHMTNNKRPIMGAKDAAGLKIRTMENKVHMDAFKALGALPTPMAWPDVYGALQQGVVDGFEAPIPLILTSKISQVQKNLSLTAHVYSPSLILMSPSSWKKLSDGDKAAFIAAGKASAAATRRKINEDEAVGTAQLRKEGMQVVEQVDSESFRKAVAPAFVAFSKQFGADKIAAIQAVK